MHQDLRARQMMLFALLPFVSLSLLNGFYKPALAVYPLWYWFADAVHFVGVPAACYFLLLRPAGIGGAELGLRITPDRMAPHRSGAWIFGAVLLVAAYWPVEAFIRALTWHYAMPSELFQMLPTASGGRLLVAIYLSASAALMEEVVFRALPWLYLGRVVVRGPRVRIAYVLVTATVFALCHSEQGLGGMLSCLWFGWLTARLYLKHGNLWPCVLGHFAVDLLIFGPW
jgi:hypothetical protein